MGVESKSLIDLTGNLWVRLLITMVISIILVVLITFKTYQTDEIKNYTTLGEFTDYLDERIPSLMDDYKIPGVNIAIVQKGKLAWSKAYGYANPEDNRKMTVDTYCRVESISKSLTSWGIMKLVEEGRIDLDKPVEKYIKNWELPDSKFSKEKITVRQLLTHTAGMPLGDVFKRYDPNEEIPSLEESLSEQAVIIKEPGSSFSYSNTGYNLLELLVEEVKGRDFAEYMENEVLIPLGMDNSTFLWSDKLNPKVPTGYDLDGNEVPVYIYPEKASGGLLASVEDIARFISAGMTDYTDNKVLKIDSINEIYRPQVDKIGIYGLVFDSYGFGHYIEELSKGIQAVSHGGQGGGIMTHFHSIPKIGDGIVILTNSQRSWPFISHILKDWGRWRGFKSVGMGKIILAQKVLWTLIVIILLLVFWQSWILVQRIVCEGYKFSPIPKSFISIQGGQIILSIILICGLLWCVRQDYLFISSVFPVASQWLGISIFISAIFLIISALFLVDR